MINPNFKTLELDIFLDIYFCPFSKISVDFISRFNNFRINQIEYLKNETLGSLISRICKNSIKIIIIISYDRTKCRTGYYFITYKKW